MLLSVAAASGRRSVVAGAVTAAKNTARLTAVLAVPASRTMARSAIGTTLRPEDRRTLKPAGRRALHVQKLGLPAHGDRPEMPKEPAARELSADEAHPEDRLKAARRRALQRMGLPADDDKPELPEEPAAREISADEAHPEDRLKAARRRALQRLGLPTDGDKPELPKETETNQLSADEARSEAAPISVCAANNHPDYRLRLARQRMEMKTMQTMQTQDKANAFSLMEGIGDVQLSPDRRLELARIEASKKVRTFPPFKRKKKARKLAVSLSALSASLEPPPPLPNDGTSSGAVADERLRAARKAAVERLLSSKDVGER